MRPPGRRRLRWRGVRLSCSETGDSLLIDAGIDHRSLCRRRSGRVGSFTVITNSLLVARELCECAAAKRGLSPRRPLFRRGRRGARPARRRADPAAAGRSRRADRRRRRRGRPLPRFQCRGGLHRARHDRQRATRRPSWRTARSSAGMRSSRSARPAQIDRLVTDSAPPSSVAAMRCAPRVSRCSSPLRRRSQRAGAADRESPQSDRIGHICC